jgi:hypothetical protein
VVVSFIGETFYRPSKNFDSAKQTTLTKKTLSDLADSVIFGRHENLLEFFKLCTLQLYITHNGSYVVGLISENREYKKNDITHNLPV